MAYRINFRDCFNDNFKIMTWLLILFIVIAPNFIFIRTASASALTRESQLVNQALNSNANTAFRDVRVMNGTVVGTIDQRVALAGSSAILSQPVSFAADYAALARSAASLATKIASGYAAFEAARWAVKKLLDGVDYVEHEGSIVKRKPVDTSPNGTYFQSAYELYVQGKHYYFSSSTAACSYYSTLLNVSPISISVSPSLRCSITFLSGGSKDTYSIVLGTASNPYYDSGSSPPSVPVSQAEMEDAFLTWMKNNPTNITDPVSQAMYTPAQTTGWNLTGAEGAHHGADGITDEIAKNILDHRNAALQQPKSYTLNDSVQPTTQVTPDGSSTTTTNNPDGSTTKRTTTTTTDPNTGKQTSTTTTTVTQPDGTSKTTTETTTTDATKTKTDIPAACEWFSTACEWFGWTKSEPAQDTKSVPTVTDQAITFDDSQRVSFGQSCPAGEPINVSFMGRSLDTTFSYQPLCDFLSMIRPFVIASSYLIGAYIVMGLSRGSSD